MTNKPTLPAFFKILFWDTDFSKIRHEKDRFCIIERALKLGRPEHIQWILQTYTENEIGKVVRKSRNIDRKTANYWGIHLKIPRKEIVCLNRQLMDHCFG